MVVFPALSSPSIKIPMAEESKSHERVTDQFQVTNEYPSFRRGLNRISGGRFPEAPRETALARKGAQQDSHDIFREWVEKDVDYKVTRAEWHDHLFKDDLDARDGCTAWLYQGDDYN